MSARLIKRGEENGGAGFYVPHTLPSFGALQSTVPAQAKAAAGVMRENAATPLPFRPRPAATTTTTQPAAATSAPAPERPAAPHTSERNPAREAEALLEQAQSEAARLLADAETRAAEIEREARERGLAEAEARAAAAAAQAVEPLRERLTQTLDELDAMRAGMAARSERDLVRLALEIAKKVVHREVTMDHEIVLTLARVALERLHNRAVATIHLHPEDYRYLLAHRDRLETGRSIELLEDRSIARGGCLVSTEMGDVDARLEQQFAEIERGFFGI